MKPYRILNNTLRNQSNAVTFDQAIELANKWAS